MVRSGSSTLSTSKETSGVLKSLTNEEIVRSIQGNLSDNLKDKYFREIYRRYSTKVFGKCLTMLTNEHDAENARQEIFTKIRLNIQKFNFHSSLSTWIYSISYNYCIDVIRKKKKVNIDYLEDMSMVERKFDYFDVDEVVDAQLLENNSLMLAIVLDSMKESDKNILIFKYHDGLSIREISQLVNITESAVKMRLKRAKGQANIKWKELFWEAWFNSGLLEENTKFDPKEWENFNVSSLYTKEISKAVK
jgi:RNA polymerase sigma factor (sigma-70 family)